MEWGESRDGKGGGGGKEKKEKIGRRRETERVRERDIGKM